MFSIYIHGPKKSSWPCRICSKALWKRVKKELKCEETIRHVWYLAQARMNLSLLPFLRSENVRMSGFFFSFEREIPSRWGEIQAMSWCLRGARRQWEGGWGGRGGYDTYVQGILSSLRLWSTVKADKPHRLGRRVDRATGGKKERNMV